MPALFNSLQTEGLDYTNGIGGDFCWFSTLG
jgi:hypothetical protein